MFSRLHRHTTGINLQTGFSLLELTVIVLILGIMAAAVAPNFYSTNPTKLDLAAQEVADAMRFARSEAMRLGKPYGFRQKSSTKRMRVFRVDTGPVPWNPVYDVYHPVSKKLYDIKLDTHPFARADSVTANRVYRGVCNKPRNVYFDGSGIPRCVDPETVLLEQFDVTLTQGTHTRVVSLKSITGQVTIQ